MAKEQPRMYGHKMTRKHLDLSTAHVTKDDMDRLRSDADCRDADNTPARGAVACTSYLYGVIVFVLNHVEPKVDRDLMLKEFRDYGYSEAFCRLYELAWTLDVDMIRLDQDGEIYEALPAFDW